jgi:hypothetical protein
VIGVAVLSDDDLQRRAALIVWARSVSFSRRRSSRTASIVRITSPSSSGRDAGRLGVSSTPWRRTTGRHGLSEYLLAGAWPHTGGVPVRHAALRMYEEGSSLHNAAIVASQASLVQLLVGDISSATAMATKSVSLADGCGDTFLMMCNRTIHADSASRRRPA